MRMEITTTMVRFQFPKKDMVKRTDKAQLFRCYNKGAKDKIWIPLSKLEMDDSGEEADTVTITMAKWLFLKTQLPLFVEWEEFIVKSEVTSQQLNQQ